MGLLKVRLIVVLCILYLSLVAYLYHYLRKTNSLENSLGFLELKPNPVPHDRDFFKFSADEVEFNFKRINPFLHHPNETSRLTLNHSIVGDDSDGERSKRTTLEIMSELPVPSRCIHAFYYMWYGTKERDGRYYHWNHRYLPHWADRITEKYPKGRHKPPDDIGASFYPELGCYSSTDPKVMRAHMHHLRIAGVGVVSVSWYPSGMSDDEGFPPDSLIPQLLDIAQGYSVQVTFHIEPYKDRSPLTVKRDLQYIADKYGSHPAFYTMNRTDTRGISRSLPLVYIYDSYLSTPDEWASVLQRGRSDSIRSTASDCVVLGLLVEKSHQLAIVNGGFDGFYTYFASNSFSHGSNPNNWRKLASFAKRNNLIFVPSVGPGYDDVQVRPWNRVNTKSRRDGAYYKEVFWAALEVGAGLISITSFNEWHEGTQIEPSISKKNPQFTYSDFTPRKPDFYLQLTSKLTRQMQCNV